ncbi:cupin domain-containing protein [Thermoplasmatota archaeon]
MAEKFPKMIKNLPEANVPLDGAKAYLSQGENHQVIFMEFEKDVELPEHSHEAQWEYVLNGMVDLWVDGIKKTYKKGDTFFVPKDVKHSGKIFAGYSSVAFFNQKDRYKKK